MGNCLRVNKVLVQDETTGPSTEEEQIQDTGFPTASNSTEPATSNEGRKKKAVMFKLDDETIVDQESSIGAKGSGVVRFRIVVTKQELNQILNYKKHSKHFSIEQLLNAMKVSNRRIAEVRTAAGGGGDTSGSWMPALESIPEDH